VSSFLEIVLPVHPEEDMTFFGDAENRTYNDLEDHLRNEESAATTAENSGT
jgi:hypothetical protein